MNNKKPFISLKELSSIDNINDDIDLFEMTLEQIVDRIISEEKVNNFLVIDKRMSKKKLDNASNFEKIAYWALFNNDRLPTIIKKKLLIVNNKVNQKIISVKLNESWLLQLAERFNNSSDEKENLKISFEQHALNSITFYKNVGLINAFLIYLFTKR